MGVIRWCLRIAIGGALILVLTAAGVLAAHFALRGSPPPQTAENAARVVLVLGSGMRPGGRISPASQIRVEKAVAFARTPPEPWLIVSDGTRYTPRTLRTSELMRDWAAQKGFPADRIVIEDKSRTTLENMSRSLPIARRLGARPGDDSLVIVTDTTHIPRALALAWVMGWGGPAVAPSNSFDTYDARGKLQAIARESLAIWWNLGKVAAWAVLGAAGLTPDQRLEYVY